MPTLAGDFRVGFAPPHWVRRVARVVAVGVLAAAAVLSGRMVGLMGQGTPTARTIAPTTQQAQPHAAAPQVAPWPLSESGPGRR